MIDVLVTGSSLPALQAALTLAEVGLRVTVVGVSGSESPRQAELPARDPSGAVAAFMEGVAAPIGPAGEIVESALPTTSIPTSPLLLDPDGSWAPQSAPNVLGIPAQVFAAETARLLGSRGTARAYLDRVTPLLTVGKTRELGELVRKRLGSSALQRLVEPQVRERFGAGSNDVEVVVAAPGLNEALSRVGALSAAVLAYADRNVARETLVQAAGGEAALRAAALLRLRAYDVQLREAEALSTTENSGSWAVELADGFEISARALVLDAGVSGPTQHCVSELLSPILPVPVRLYSTIAIGRPAWLVGGDRAVTTIARDPFGEVSLRVEGHESSTSATLAFRAVGGSGSHASDPGIPSKVEFDALLAMCDLSPADGAEWVHRSVAAPYLTVADRERASEALLAFAGESGNLLAVGSYLHGSELDRALASARETAIELRRRLTGISE